MNKSFSILPGLLLPGLFLASLLLGSCTAPPPAQSPAPIAPQTATDLESRYVALGRSGGRLYRIDPQTSTIRLYVYRGGKLAKLGHNHILSAPRFTGYVHLPDSNANMARFDLEFRLDELEIDAPAIRSTLGEAYASPMSPEDIEGTRKHMLGDDNMQADRYPFVRLSSGRIVGEPPRLAAVINVEMHGQQRDMQIPLDVAIQPDRLTAAGSFVLRQSDFGIKPYSVAGGLLAVQDDVVAEFRLTGLAIPPQSNP